MSFTPIGDALKDKMQQQKTLKGQIVSGQVIDAATAVFIELFGEEQAQHIKPLFLKNRTITVTCSSSVIAQEIRLNQPHIVSLINKKAGNSEVDRIRYLT